MSRGTGAARHGARVGVALATAGLVALPLTAAQAVGPDEELPTYVDLAEVEVDGSFLVPVETLPDFDPSKSSATDFFSAVPVAPGGEVTISLPPGVEVPDAGATTLAGGTEDQEPVGEQYAFEASDGGPLTAAVEDGSLVVTLPAAEDLPAELVGDAILSVPVEGGGLDQDLFYYLDLGSSAGGDALELAPVLVTTASAFVGYRVETGSSIELDVTDADVLAGLGVTSLDPLLVSVTGLGELVAPAPAVAVDVDGLRATVTLSPETVPEDYVALLTLQPRDGDGVVEPQLLVQVDLPLGVVEAAAEPAPAPSAEPTTAPAPAPAPPAEKPRQNEGLRSNTGVEETGTSTTALVAGGGVLLLGLAAGAALLRRRTQR